MPGFGFNLRLPGLSARNTGAGDLVSPYLGQIATRAMIPTSFFATPKQMNVRRAMYNFDDSITAVQIGIPNRYVDGFGGGATYTEKGPGGAATVSASIERPGNVFDQFKWSGASSAVLADGDWDTLSDPLAINLSKGWLWPRIFWQNPAGIIFTDDYGAPGWVKSAALGDLFEVGASGLADKTMGGTIASSGENNMFAPLCLVGITRKRSYYIPGDSLTTGEQDVQDASGNVGIAARRVGRTNAYINGGVRGHRADRWNADHVMQAGIAKYASDVRCALGVNDIYNGVNAATTLASLQTLWATFPSQRVSQQTITPNSSSTDNWATTANQTAIRQSIIATLNDALRTSPPAGGLIDASDLVSTARNSGVFKAPGFTGDGLHLKPYGYKFAGFDGVVSTPDLFMFTDVTGAAASAVYTSNEINLAGFNTSASISIVGGEYSINGGPFTSSSGTAQPSDAVNVRLTSASVGVTAANATLTVGGVSDTYTVTTAPLTIFDAAKTSASITLAEDGARMTGAATGDHGAKSVLGRSAGLYYFEAQRISGIGNIGLATSAFSVDSWVGSSGASIGIASDGNIYTSGGNAGSSGVGVSSDGDVYGFAVNFTLGKFWVRRNGSFGSGQNPLTNTGGFALPAGLLYIMASVAAIGRSNRIRGEAPQFRDTPPSNGSTVIYLPWAG